MVKKPIAQLQEIIPDEPVLPASEPRQAIIDAIKTRLGAGLSGVYADAIRSSVSTGCYDADFERGQPPYPTIERYVALLKANWASKQGDRSAVVERFFELLDFGTDAEKAQLRALLQME